MVCSKCRGSVTIFINETVRVPENCPACLNEWRSEEHRGIPTAAETLTRALKGWIQSENNNPPFSLRFEIKP
jgi:hypothetical protein